MPRGVLGFAGRSAGREKIDVHRIRNELRAPADVRLGQIGDGLADRERGVDRPVKKAVAGKKIGAMKPHDDFQIGPRPFPPPRHRPVERLGQQDGVAAVARPRAARAPREMEPLDEPLKARAEIGNRARFPVRIQLEVSVVGRWVRPGLGSPPKSTTSWPSRCSASPTVKENVSMPPTSGEPGRSNVALGRKMPIFMTRRACGPATPRSARRPRASTRSRESSGSIVEMVGLERAMQIRPAPGAGRRLPWTNRDRSARRASASGSRRRRRGDRAPCRRRERRARAPGSRQFDERHFPGEDLARSRFSCVAAMCAARECSLRSPVMAMAQPYRSTSASARPRPIFNRPALDFARGAGMDQDEIFRGRRRRRGDGAATAGASSVPGPARRPWRDCFRWRDRWRNRRRRAGATCAVFAIQRGIARPARAITQEPAHAAAPEVRHEVGLGHVGEQRDGMRVAPRVCPRANSSEIFRAR